MNTRDLAQQKAYEVLQGLGISPDAIVAGTAGTTALTVATCAILEGWVHGIKDAQRISDRRRDGDLGIALLRRQAG